MKVCNLHKNDKLYCLQYNKVLFSFFCGSHTGVLFFKKNCTGRYQDEMYVQKLFQLLLKDLNYVFRFFFLKSGGLVPRFYTIFLGKRFTIKAHT
jgi:hypothetical protein